MENKRLKRLKFKGIEMTKLPEQFEDKYGTVFKKDTKARDVLNKLLSANIVAVYTADRISYDAKAWFLDWSTEDWYIVNSKLEWIKMSNSEWASLLKVDTKSFKFTS